MTIHSSQPASSMPPPSAPTPMSSQQSSKDIQLPPSPNQPGDEQTKTPQRAEGHAYYPTSTPTPTQLPLRPGNHSPPSTHSRDCSSPAMPLMQRAHSSPGVDSSGRVVTPSFTAPGRPSSPLTSGRRRSPMRTMEDTYPSSWYGVSIEPNIPENEELELSSPVHEHYHTSPLPSYHNTFPRARRRPISQLHQSASAPSLYARAASPNLSGAASPLLSAQKYANEPYPMYSLSSTSSMPSTPTSLRSRSPSISSLDTIEDTPDAEEAARLEEEEVKHRGDDAEGGGELRRRTSLDLRGSGLRSNKERKRWSVCGAERRADFSLEPIEE